MATGNRKNELRSLFSGGPLKPAEAATVAPEVKSLSGPGAAPAELTAVNPTVAALPSHSLPSHSLPGLGEAPRATSGAVKAMGLTLGSITRDAEEARQLRQTLSDGEHIVALDPSLIDGSFVSDRISDDNHEDADFLALVESIRSSGQQSPILVRPNATGTGRYETAYGHRRLEAARSLGLKVKAIIRPLSDDELVLAQGKENAERRNLSFIERALFAKGLSAHGFDRKVIGDALSIDKTELSRLLQVAESVPEQIARNIGPAPKTGRSRWMTLAALLSTEGARMRALDEATSQRCQAADSDTRFAMVLARLQSRERPEGGAGEELKDPAGKVFARLKRGKAMRIDFVAGIDDGFLDEITTLIAERYRAHVEGLKE